MHINQKTVCGGNVIGAHFPGIFTDDFERIRVAETRLYCYRASDLAFAGGFPGLTGLVFALHFVAPFVTYFHGPGATVQLDLLCAIGVATTIGPLDVG